VGEDVEDLRLDLDGLARTSKLVAIEVQLDVAEGQDHGAIMAPGSPIRVAAPDRLGPGAQRNQMRW
jgi:hypothetical protein